MTAQHRGVAEAPTQALVNLVANLHRAMNKAKASAAAGVKVFEVQPGHRSTVHDGFKLSEALAGIFEDELARRFGV